MFQVTEIGGAAFGFQRVKHLAKPDGDFKQLLHQWRKTGNIPVALLFVRAEQITKFFHGGLNLFAEAANFVFSGSAS